MQAQTPSPIWTIGHSTMSSDDFVALLRANDIDVVVDVRTSPYSRFASQFNKLDLDDTLRRRGIEYRYEGHRLGGRPSDPTCYRSGEMPDHAAREDFLKLVDYEEVKRKDWFQEALDEVMELASLQHLALMCSEENPLDCHRHRLIGSALDDRGIEIRHIRRDGTVTTATFSRQPDFMQTSLF